MTRHRPPSKVAGMARDSKTAGAGRPRRYTVAGTEVEAPLAAAGLYWVATPIRNLRDISLRALETLAAADVIACEDSRVTRKLTEHYGIATPLTPYHEHNAAGTPLISDPGYRLVREAVDAGFTVIPVPGASAVLSALGVAGLPTDRFFFEGFLPPKQAARQKRIAALADLAAGLGPRAAAICRELTKLHEELRRGSLPELARHYAEGGETRGEIVIVVAPPADDEGQADDVDDLLRRALARVSVKDAVGEVALATGRPRREVYQRALALANATGEKDNGDGAA